MTYGELVALGIHQAVIGGFDWGARTANILAALWSERCRALIAVSGYLIGNQEAGKQPLSPVAEHAWWYQFHFATSRGRAGYETYRKDFAKLIWQTASPQWRFDEATFDRSAQALDMSASRSTTLAGGLASPRASRATMRLRSAWRGRRTSPCLRSP